MNTINASEIRPNITTTTAHHWFNDAITNITENEIIEASNLALDQLIGQTLNNIYSINIYETTPQNIINKLQENASNVEIDLEDIEEDPITLSVFEYIANKELASSFEKGIKYGLHQAIKDTYPNLDFSNEREILIEA